MQDQDLAIRKVSLKQYPGPKYKMPRFRRNKRSNRRRMNRRRKPTIARSRRGLIQPVQFFKRSVYLPGWSATGTSDVPGSFVFKLSDIPSASEFTNLYDHYKINLVKWTIIPRGNTSDVTTAGNSMGVFTAIDYDSNTTPTSLDDLLEYQNMRMTRSTQQHKRVFRPLARDGIIGSASALVSGQYRGWIDCTADTVPHYAIKYWFQALPTGTQQYDLKVDYYLAFKNVR